MRELTLEELLLVSGGSDTDGPGPIIDPGPTDGDFGSPSDYGDFGPSPTDGGGGGVITSPPPPPEPTDPNHPATSIHS